MSRTSLAMMVLVGTTFCFGQAASSAPPAATSHATVGQGSFAVKVTKTLDSSKVKEGETVEVETAGSFKLADGTVVPKGSKLTGQVTAAKARSKGDSDSELVIAFDKLNVTNGKQLSIKGTVQAVFPPKDESTPMMAGKASGAAGGGYGADNVGTVGTTKSGSNMDSSATVDPAVDTKSIGVQGIHDLELNNGALTSKGKNVKLGTGVRMIVHVDILG
jgi:hypothetical protein